MKISLLIVFIRNDELDVKYVKGSGTRTHLLGLEIRLVLTEERSHGAGIFLKTEPKRVTSSLEGLVIQ